MAKLSPLLVRLSFALALLVAGAAACGGVIHDAEKGVHTTEKEVSGAKATKDVERGVGTLQKDVTGKGHDAGDASDQQDQ